MTLYVFYTVVSTIISHPEVIGLVRLAQFIVFYCTCIFRIPYCVRACVCFKVLNELGYEL